MTNVDWNTLLNSSKPEEVTKPKTLPVGSYLAMVTGYVFEASKQKNTPYVQMKFKPVQPGPDVDAGLFQAFGGMEKLAARELKKDYYFTADAQWRLREFLEKACKINFGGRGWQPVIADAVGKQVRLFITHRVVTDQNNPTKEPETYADVNDVAAV